eukprot:30996-Pelagococcus_subviridis.AAC.5
MTYDFAFLMSVELLHPIAAGGGRGSGRDRDSFLHYACTRSTPPAPFFSLLLQSARLSLGDADARGRPVDGRRARCPRASPPPSALAAAVRSRGGL